MTVVDEVKQKIDIVEVIGQYTTLKKAGRNLTALCPFHSEKHPSFFVYPEQQSWHCFGACGTGGDVFSFIMKKDGIEFAEALRQLAEKAGVTLPTKYEGNERKEETDGLFQINEAASQYFHNLLLNSPAAEKARHYITGRGLSPKIITAFQLGYALNSWDSLKQYLLQRNYSEEAMLSAGLIIKAENGQTHDRFRDRLLFSIRDIRGRTTGFGARVLDDSLPKYVNSPESPLFDKSSTLYGIDMAAPAIRQQDLAVIVEGYMDVIAAHQYGFTNVVASMGTAVTEKQINILKKLSKNLILALDSDAAGEEAMLRSVGFENTLGTEMKVITLPKDKDPDDVMKEDAEAWPKLVSQAAPIIDFTFDMVTARLDLTKAQDQSLAVKSLGTIVNGMKDTVRRAHYIQKLARLTKNEVRTIEAALNEMKAPVRSRIPAQRQPAVNRALRPLTCSPQEEYFLTLLLQHPELKDKCGDLSPDYFEGSQNREIIMKWLRAEDPAALKESLDVSIHEYIDSLLTKTLPSANIDERYADCIRELREKSLRNLQNKRAAIFALEAESGGAGADLAKLEEQGLEPNLELKEVFKKSRKKTG